MDIEEAHEICQDVKTEILDSVVLSEQFLDIVLTGVLAEGHVLLEDVPGTVRPWPDTFHR